MLPEPSNASVRFNPRAPCGARHALDLSEALLLAFQSTRPVWGATIKPIAELAYEGVSIHAPRVGRDQYALAGDGCAAVSIHAPRVGRDYLPRALC